jgi:mono/diheme cytochrome c family protein
MKKTNPYWKMSACLAAAALAFLGSLSAVQAQAPALSGEVVIRPLTPTEIATYGLASTNEASGGLSTVALGEPVYLDALVNAAIAPSDIVGVTWVLTNKPTGSAAALLTSPLGTNVPIFNPADRYDNTGAPVFQLAGRTFFRPDVVGSYTVLATITTMSSGSTNLAINITGGTYLGVQTCAACHSGEFSGAPSIYLTYTNTPHASMFTRAIDGLVSSHYSKSCIVCHTLGYDTNSFAVNGGFDDVALEYGWTFPSVLTNGNWAAMPAAVQNLANIQCENCHGPGSQHLYSQGIVGNTNAISVNYAAGDCSQCHDDLNNHIKSAEWNNSVHAVTTRDPAGNASCVGCHTAPGFIGRMSGWGYTNTAYEAITCQTCHDPHTYNAVSNPEELRVSLTNSVTLMDGTVVTNAGLGTVCMECHHSRQNAAVYAATSSGSTYFGPHEGPQADMLEGANGFTYGEAIPSSAHANAVTNTCVTCHMQTVASSDPGFTHVGGHTFNISWAGNGTNAGEDLVAACQNCHGPSVTSFNFPLQDYAGIGVIEGVQDEVQALMDKLAMLLPPVGQPKSDITIDSTWTQPQLEAAYNYRFVQKDGSLGIHNTAYAVGLLKASIANLTGVSVPGGLPDAWAIQYFGSITNPAAAPNAVNNTSGVPNWMMYALGLNPTAGFQTAGSGEIFINGNNIVNGATNTIAIYTAAEVAFDTQVGTTYTVQGIDALSGSWQNISTNIPGTGGTISYLTPTRQNTQMFFRVVHTP